MAVLGAYGCPIKSRGGWHVLGGAELRVEGTPPKKVTRQRCDCGFVEDTDGWPEPAPPPVPQPPKQDVLAEAASIVGGARQADYGTPLANHTRTAQLWSTYLDHPVTARDVCMLNILQKVSRDRHGAKRDNLVDIAGYARNAELCAELCAEQTASPVPSRLEPVDPPGRTVLTYGGKRVPELTNDELADAWEWLADPNNTLMAPNIFSEWHMALRDESRKRCPEAYPPYGRVDLDKLRACKNQKAPVQTSPFPSGVPVAGSTAPAPSGDDGS